MKLILRMIRVAMALAGLLVFSMSFQTDTSFANARQLSGEAAWEFLTQEGILEQIATKTSQVPPQGRYFGEPPPVIASDGAAGDEFAISVAVDGDTAVVGAHLADVGGEVDQGAVYVFTRSGISWSQQQKLVAGDGVAGDSFGVSVAVSGETALVGANRADVSGEVDLGAAYVFIRSGTTWSQKQKLVAGDGAAFDRFGSSVALDGDTAVIGADLADVSGEVDQGTAYVFICSGTTWSQQQKLVAGDGAADDYFGGAVAIDEDTAVIGADRADVSGEANQGAAYVFTRRGMIWSQAQKLVAGDGAASDNFGDSVAIASDTVVAGVPGADVSGEAEQGAAYVFTNSGTSWDQAQKLVAEDGVSGDAFGHSVTMDGDTVVVGAHLADVSVWANRGVAYIFNRSGTSWDQAQKLAAREGAAGDRFGCSVDLDGDTVVVGAHLADVSGALGVGKVYLAERGPVQWLQTSSVVANDGVRHDEFGYSVAIDGDTAVVGAKRANVSGKVDQGAAYVFIRNGPTWVQRQKLVAADGMVYDEFGYSVALDGDTAIVGAYQANVSGDADRGAAYVFTWNGSLWVEQQKLVASDGEVGDEFGISVAVAGDTAMVGAHLADVNDELYQGAVYVFIRNGPTWVQQQKLVAADGEVGDEFGISVAVDGDTAVVGAHLTDVSGEENQGSASIFIWNGSIWVQQQRLVALDGEAYDEFGISVALDGDTVVVGAHLADMSGDSWHGAAYVFIWNGSIWVQQQKLVALDGGILDEFGISVEVDRDTIAVGAFLAPVGGDAEHGAAYTYIRNGESWSQRGKLLPNDGTKYDDFGISVAVADNTAMVGAHLVNVSGEEDQGRVYFFERQPHEFEVYFPVVLRDY